ncbi:U5 small nuclear ribonucleoprotein helicase [Blastocystis sp. ATCC 50177/Nand II]|uniref:U5 small nuclear ribonucleoprotein helicase n=1 Tax=Blastocystis sp. subtype 1 (strain ATCC 50177 / NandII) TaxID=478820 RepID=A0A196S8V1_BLAHN|nr:U5 small nuclear ribonucleoprotein helicase [Blastocystis sp. ATCC 50177/Nand II]
MNAADAQLVLELYKNDWIQVLVTTAELCWELELAAHLVIVMDTCFYDGKEHRHVDYPIVDILQMIGFASRSPKYGSGKVVVMAHTSRKAYLNKFLFDPLPVESSLHLHLGDPLLAAVVSHTVGSMQDAMEWLTWFFFYRRLPQNPNYYGLAGVSDTQLSEFVSVLTENTVDELAKAGAVECSEEGVLSPLNMGVLSTHLYIQYHTTELFALSITAKAKRRGLLQILASANEFEKLPIRQHEQLLLERMEKRLTYVLENATLTARKVNVLLQTHFSREPVPADLHRDALEVLPTAVRLLHGMVNVCSSSMWLKPAIAAIELCQMVVQGQWNEDSRLLQLPHFDKDRARAFENEGVDDVFAFLEMEDDARKALLEGLSEKEVEDIVMWCNDYPDIEVTPTLASASVKPGEDGVLSVELSAGEDGFSTQVRSNVYPQECKQTWWLILGDPEDNSIHSIVEVDLDRGNKKTLQFTAPAAEGHYKWMLYFMTDAYIGCDQEQEIEFDVVNA